MVHKIQDSMFEFYIANVTFTDMDLQVSDFIFCTYSPHLQQILTTWCHIIFSNYNMKYIFKKSYLNIMLLEAPVSFSSTISPYLSNQPFNS